MAVSTDPRIGRELLGYRIEALIGRGGMSVVYRAEDLRLKRKVALKLLAPELAQDERFRERFLRESELAASLDHPHIVPIYEAGEHEGELWIAMRYVEGSDLKRVLKDEGALEPKRALAYLEELADALDAAHARGLVHRDVKPSNALLDSAGHLYLSDFGLTKSASDRSALTLTGRIIGTVDYAAPEQIEGKPVDGRADIYSLGCLLYECLAGAVPFPRDSELAVLWAHVNEPPPKLAAYPALDPVIAKVLAKEPRERHASCRELLNAVREALGLREVAVVRDRRPLLLGALGVLLAAGALAAGLVLTLDSRSRPSKPSTKPTLAITADSIQRIDPTTNKLVATIRPGTEIGGIAAGEGAVWATGATDGSLLRIDPKTSTISARGSAGPAQGSPTYPATGAGAVWISITGGDGYFTEIDPNTLRILTTGNPWGAGGFNPGAIAVGDGAAWNLGGNQNIFRITYDGLFTSAVVPDVPGFPGASLAVGAGAVWVAGYTSVIRLNPVTLKVAASVPLSFLPTKLAALPGGVWVLDTRDNAVVRIDPRRNRVVAKLNVGRAPTGIAASRGVIWVANSGDGTVSRIDAETGNVVATVKVGSNPSDLAAGEGGVWVVVHPT